MNKTNLNGLYYLGFAMLIIIILFTSTKEETEPNVKVVIYPEIHSRLVDTLSASEHEFVFCLRGQVKEDVIIINNFAEPEVIDSSRNHVQAKECRFPDVIGLIHPHLGSFSSCMQSPADIYTFGSVDVSINAIMCQNGKEFAFYTPGLLTKPLDWRIGYE